MIKIFLDDIRNPNDCVHYMHKRIGKDNPIYLEDWVIVRNYEEFEKTVDRYFPNISHISFDHDLADEHYDPTMFGETSKKYNEIYRQFKEKTGVDCAKYVKDIYTKNEITYPTMYVHSMNPVGTQNIINIFK